MLNLQTDPAVDNIFADQLEATPLPAGATNLNVLFENGEWSGHVYPKGQLHSDVDMVRGRSAVSLLAHFRLGFCARSSIHVNCAVAVREVHRVSG